MQDVNPAGFIKTIQEYNAAVKRDVKFDTNIKDGKRTLITLESIERRRKAVLTKATFKPPKPRARPGQCDAGGHEQVAVRSPEAIEAARERA